MLFSLLPRKVYQTESAISGEIVVKEQFGNYWLEVDHLTQSGQIIKQIWRSPLKKFHNSQFTIHNSLVLGLGGGSVVGSVQKYWPEAKIIGVEIDPEVIKIGKKYFGLDKIQSLKIIQANAIDFVKKTKEKFDLILVDLYIGHNRVPMADINLKKILTENGVIIFNQFKAGKNTFRIVK